MPAKPDSPDDRNRRLTDLLHACAQGRQDAFQDLYRLVSPQLFAVLLRILRRRDLAEEAMQDAFISVWRNAASYSADKGTPMTWLVSICRYRALDMLRRAQREVPLGRVDDGESGSTPDALVQAPAETTLVSKAEARALEECLKRLDDGQRASLRLAYFDGCTHQEIAANMNTPIGTVKSWVRRGLQSLRRCLEAA